LNALRDLSRVLLVC